MAAKKRAAAQSRVRAHESTPSARKRIPRGGLWRVSLCVGGNRWRTIPGAGSHAEADFIADNYRRKCKRVAVHRLGQPPRERTAAVLPASYRPPARDKDTIQKLLAEFVHSNDKASAIVLKDALLEDGYDWAAFDLQDSLDRGCRERRGLANRILSEVLNGSTILEHGEWNWRTSRGPYVLIHEQKPIRFHGGTRRGTTRKHEPRFVLWTRTRTDLAGNTRCKWILYGSYGLSEYGSMTAAEKMARRDIQDLKGTQTPHGSTIPFVDSEPSDYETCSSCGYDHEYESVQAQTWHTENPNG